MARRTLEEATAISDEAVELIEGIVPAMQIVEDTAIVEYQPASHTGLAGSLASLRHSIEAAAEQEVERAIEEAGGRENFTALEIRSMTAVQALRNVGGLELTAVLLRAYYIRLIQEQNLVASHPGRYEDLYHMAQENGVSKTELVRTLDFVNVIFPFVQDELGIPIPDLWERVGKTKLSEMMPVLKSLITGEEGNAASVRAAVDFIMEDMYASMQASDDPRFEEADGATDDEQEELIRNQIDRDARRMAVAHLIEQGEILTHRQLRTTLRPEPTAPLNLLVIEHGGRKYVVSRIDEDQYNVLTRRMDTRADVATWRPPTDPGRRQREGLHYPELRELFDLLSGQ